jgi:hypothetical protein
MANQTVTTAVNYDAASISGLLDGETLTINAGSVTINADVRWNQQAAVFGAVSISSTLGGSFLIDGTQVWEVPFSASTGNVPTQAALGSNGVTGGTSGASGELTRVWATGSLTPATAGGAMPSNGFIKLRSRTGTFQAGETITLPGGATVTASGAGRRSWIHVVGRGAPGATGSRATLPRLGTFTATGDWYELGTTNGAANQTFNFPVADQCPAIWIETGPGTNTYEIWLNAGDRWGDSAIATGDRRGMYFSCNATTGVITIASRGANNAGLQPPSGCRVRIPNVIMSQADGIAPNYAANILPATITARYGFTTTAGGSITMSRVLCNWHVSASNPFSASITDSGIGTAISFSNVGLTTTMSNVGVGVVDAIAQAQMSITDCLGGGSITDVFCAKRVSNSGQAVAALTGSAGFTLTRCRFDALGATGSYAPAGVGITVSAADVTMASCVAVGVAVGISLASSFATTVTDFRYASRSVGTTQSTDTSSACTITNSSADVSLSGFSNFDGIANVHPYSQLVAVQTSSSRVVIADIGTPSSPYDMGLTNPCGVIVAVSSCRGVTVRRCYAQNTRTSAVSTVSTAQDVALTNVWGDAADSQNLQSINTIARGCRFTLGTSGANSCYGTHWSDAFTGTTTGRIVIHCNEPTAATVSQCEATLDGANGSGFTSAGSVVMARLTDEIIWTMPNFALGITGFANAAPTITGTNAANHTLEFQHDTGGGFNGTWLALTGANLAAVSVNPSVGVRLRVRAKVNTASTSNLLTYIRLDTITDATSQQIQYPLPGSLVSVSSLAPGSRVKITRVDTGALLAQDSTAGTSLTFDVPYSGAVRIEARNASGSQPYRPWATQISIATGTTTSVTALQEQD